VSINILFHVLNSLANFCFFFILRKTGNNKCDTYWWLHFRFRYNSQHWYAFYNLLCKLVQITLYTYRHLSCHIEL